MENELLNLFKRHPLLVLSLFFSTIQFPQGSKICCGTGFAEAKGLIKVVGV